MKTAVSTTILFLFISLKAFSAAEFLPPTTPDQYSQQVQQIQQLLPWSRYNNLSNIQLQHYGFNELKKAFPEFEKWAAEKPDPITITITKKELSTQLTYSLLPEHFQPLNQNVFRRLQELLKISRSSNANDTVKAMRDQVYQDLESTLLGNSDSIRGLITGILQAVPKEKRGEIFKAGAPSLQLQLIRNLNLDDAALRSGSFQAERFNLNSQTITWPEIFQLIESKIGSHQNVLTQLGLLISLKRLGEKEISDIESGRYQNSEENLLKPTDFRFLDKSDIAFLTECEFELSRRFPDTFTKLQKLLPQALAAVPKQWFHKTQAIIEVQKPYLKIIEVHPYLGIYRGCIGGDCSTYRSPMYPFSPWEHDYYIALPDGSFVGYVSATRVEVDGKPAFYLKDVTGHTLAPNYAEAVVYAFSKAYAYYKTTKYLLASVSFTGIQNHYLPIKERLSSFNGGTIYDGGPTVQMVPISFPDEKIRMFIRDDPNFKSGYDYDLPSYHQNAAVFAPRSNFFDSYNVSFAKGTIEAFKPQTSKESLIFALRMLSADPTANISAIPGVQEYEVRNVFQQLKNDGRSNLSSYFQQIGDVFRKYGIELSRSFRLENESFFMLGQLFAPDAFRSGEAYFAENEKFFVGFIRRVKDLNSIASILFSNSSELKQSKKVSELIDLFSSRGEAYDVAVLILFAEAGFTKASAVLQKPEFASKIADVVQKYVLDLKPTDPNPVRLLQSNLMTLRSDFFIRNTIDARNLSESIKRRLAGIGIQDVAQFPNLQGQLQLALLEAQDPHHLGKSEFSLSTFRQLFENKSIPFDKYFFPILTMWHQSQTKDSSNFPQSQHHNLKESVPRSENQYLEFFQHRYQYLKNASRNNVDAALEAYFIKKFVPQVEALLSSGYFAPAMAIVFADYLSNGQTWMNISQFRRVHTYISYHADTPPHWGMTEFSRVLSGSGIEAAKQGADFLEDLNRNLKPLSLNAAAFLKNPTLKKHLQKIHMQAFLSSMIQTPIPVKGNENLTGRTWSWLADLIEGGNTEFQNSIVGVSREVVESSQFQKFLERLAKSANQGNQAAKDTLVILIKNDRVPYTLNLSDALLREWFVSPSKETVLYAAFTLLKRGGYQALTQTQLHYALHAATQIINSSVSEKPMEYQNKTTKFDRALEIFLQTPIGESSTHSWNPRAIFSPNFPPRIAVKSALIFAKAGLRFTDYGYQSFKVLLDKDVLRLAQDQDFESQRLLAQYRSVYKVSTPSNALLCKTLFK